MKVHIGLNVLDCSITALDMVVGGGHFVAILVDVSNKKQAFSRCEIAHPRDCFHQWEDRLGVAGGMDSVLR